MALSPEPLLERCGRGAPRFRDRGSRATRRGAWASPEARQCLGGAGRSCRRPVVVAGCRRAVPHADANRSGRTRVPSRPRTKRPRQTGGPEAPAWPLSPARTPPRRPLTPAFRRSVPQFLSSSASLDWKCGRHRCSITAEGCPPEPPRAAGCLPWIAASRRATGSASHPAHPIADLEIRWNRRDRSKPPAAPLQLHQVAAVSLARMT
jgi:hypothetical protein